MVTLKAAVVKWSLILPKGFSPLNTVFFDQIESILHSERINAYRQDGAFDIMKVAQIFSFSGNYR